MLKILKSLLVVAALITLVTGATMAYFSDTETISGNQFTAGTLDVLLGKSAGKPFNVALADPGYTTPWEYIDIQNVGSLPFEAYLYVTEEPGSDTGLYNQVYLDLSEAGPDNACATGDDESVLESHTLHWWQGHYSRVSDNTFKAHGTPGNDNINPGVFERLCQRLRLSESAGNDVQNKIVYFTERIDVRQDNDI